MNIVLKSIHMENFKIFQSKTISLGRITRIFAQNYKGKSSIADAFNWLLFSKSATGNSEGKQFIPRRYDSQGNPIDHVDVVVELTIEVDGREITIKKTQVQKWVRKRGDEIQTYEGDKNIYHWNEVEVSETEHKRRVAEIIDEEVFRLITNPHAFVGKKQDDQRKFLVEKVAQITDADVLGADEGFAQLRTLLQAKTLEEVKAINKKALQGHKSQRESIPVRIDEVSKQIVDIDFAEQELALAALKIQQEEIERKIADTSEAYKEVANIKTEIADYRSKLTEIENSEKNTLAIRRREAQTKVDNAAYSLVKAIQIQNTTEADIEPLRELISSNEIFMEVHKAKFSEAKAKEIDPSKNICPNCHRELTDDMKAEALANFETTKAAEVEQLKNEGNALYIKIKANKTKLTELEANLTTQTSKVEKLTLEEAAAKNVLSELPTEIDLSENATYQSYKATIAALENALKQTEESLADTNILKAELTARKADIQVQIEAVTRELGKKQSIDDAKDRVTELREELKNATIKAAECERLDFEIEKFEKSKRNMLSEKINGRFRKVKWMLYRTQKNGGIEDVCVCTINGAPYGENTTSTTERLMAGVDIIATLQDIYGAKAPIFIDNKESYNDANVPSMDCQLIMLSVSEDKDIRVEVES